MEITDAAFDQLQMLLRDSDLRSNGIAVVTGRPTADLVRTDEGKAEWRFVGDHGWRVIQIPIPNALSNRIHTYRGIKFFLSAKPVPTQLDFIEGHFSVNGEQAI